MRRTALAQVARKVISQGGTIPPATGGWDAVSPLANMPLDRAVVLDNWIPRPGWIEVRPGYDVHAFNVGTATTPVETLMPYNAFGTTDKLFAVAGGTIYDVTATGGATVAAGTATGLTNSRLQFTMFSNASGSQFLAGANGVNVPRIYNGTTWSAMALTGSTTPSNIVQITQYKGRMWFLEVNATAAHYLPIGSITGATSVFEVGSFMTRGGYIQAIGTWTIDTRQTVDEYIAFITSRGQVIVYQGTNPAADFTLVGIYNVGAPIGRRCFLRLGGDLIIICVDGLLPMSSMLSTDRAAANRVSITVNIMNAMAQAAQSYKDLFGWQFIEYPKGTLAILNIPTLENDEQMQFAMNTLTGAWTRFVGINANCWVVDSSDRIYFGGNDGIVYEWDIGASDFNNQIVATVRSAFNSFGNAAISKRWTMMQPLIVADGNVSPSMGINVDFRSDALLTQPSVFEPPTVLWNNVNWNQFNWPGVIQQAPNWISISGIGHWCSIGMQVTTGDLTVVTPATWGVATWEFGEWFHHPTQKATVQVNGFNILYEPGAYV